MLRRLVIEGSQEIVTLDASMSDQESVNPENVKAAAVMLVTSPILLVYPFLQKYFVKGIIVGSLKG